MPVEKFRSLEEMNAAPIRAEAWMAFERFIRHCNRYRLISKRIRPHGVFKFRSIEDAQAARSVLK
ncbi:MAG: hypothetical protein JXA73_03435 [Acidobacteria bacterium]|nr:hypothetical protein [Acidobacteriota bacterium]